MMATAITTFPGEVGFVLIDHMQTTIFEHFAEEHHQIIFEGTAITNKITLLLTAILILYPLITTQLGHLTLKEAVAEDLIGSMP
jgi:hypothetical protein